MAAAGGAGSVTAAELFRWAQLTWPDLFPDAPPIDTVPYQGQPLEVRLYANGNALGVWAGHAWGLGPFTQGQLIDFGPVANVAGQVCAEAGCGPSLLGQGGTFGGVTVGAPSLTSLSGVLLQGGALDAVHLTGNLTGNVSALSGRNIVIFVEESGGLFSATGGSLTVQNRSPWAYDLALPGQAMLRAGRFTGAVKVYACLDTACSTRLAGTPVTLPYDVRVSEGWMLDAERIDVVTPFGSAPVERLINGRRGTQVREIASVSVSFDPFTLERAVEVERVNDAGQPDAAGERLRLRFAPGAVGYESGTLQLRTSVVMDNGERLIQARDLPLTYRIEASDAAFAVKPASMTLPLRGDDLMTASAQFLSANGADLQLRVAGLQWQASPSNDPGNPALASLLQLGLGFNQLDLRAVACVTQVDAAGTAHRHCVAPGTYRADVKLQASVQDPATQATRLQDFSYPVTLIVQP